MGLKFGLSLRHTVCLFRSIKLIYFLAFPIFGGAYRQQQGGKTQLMLSKETKMCTYVMFGKK